MNEFTPEFGQIAYGQPSQQFEVPEIMDAVLAAISAELERVMWNIHQEEYASPFSNTGNRFECDTFKAHAYDWGDEEQPWNFAWRDLRISWYKWCGRGCSANMEITPDLAAQCLDECLGAVRNLEPDEAA